MDLLAKNYRLVNREERFSFKIGYTRRRGDYTLLRAANGQHTVVAAAPGGNLHLHSARDPLAEARLWATQVPEGTEPVLVMGLGLGWGLQALAERFPKRIIVAVEPDLRLANLALHTIDLALLPANTHILAGWEEQQVYTKLNRIARQWQIAIFTPEQRLWPAYFGTLQKLVDKHPLFELGAEWQYPKFNNEYLHIIFVDSGYVLTKECVTALINLGHRVEYIHIDKDNPNVDYGEFVRSFLNLVRTFKPDMLLTVNHMGFDSDGRFAALLTELNLPHASWFVDSPTVILSGYEQNVSPHCHLFIWDRDYLEEVQAMGYPHVHYLPLGAFTGLFRPEECQPVFPVAFVGSSMLNSIHKNMRSFITRPDLLALLDTASHRLLDTSYRRPADVIAAMQNEGAQWKWDNPSQQADFEAAMLWRCTQIYRLSGLQKLADFSPSVFGDPGWDQLLDSRFEINREISYYDGMPGFYNRTEIQFNMTSRQMTQAVNQRVFDVPSCRHFILTDYRPQLDEIFEPGEIVSFSNPEEIPELVKFYLNNPDERKRIATLGYEKVTKYHTYEQRLSRLLELVKTAY